MRRLILSGLFLALTATSALAGPAPKVSIASLKDLPTPLPSPYVATANAQAEVAAAAARARADHKLLLIDLGGNWCGDCRVLAGIMRLPEVATFVAAHYVVVTVDVGHMNRNLDIPARYGVTKLDGVPSLLVVDNRGRLKDAGHVAALADARHMTPQGLADWLASWTS
ncbi:MAG TPA: thioredoxin family protein [Caulobacteraceae bacterium]